MTRSRRPLVGLMALALAGVLGGCVPPAAGGPDPDAPASASTGPADAPAPPGPATPGHSGSAPSSSASSSAPPAHSSPASSPASSPTAPAATPTPAVGSALRAVDALTVKGRAPRTGYDRDEFGPRWADVDRNGCDTRNDVLRRDLVARTTKPGTHGCVVLTGTLLDPYTGERIAFVRGQGTSQAVQIDHVVALADAWQKGAQGWDDRTRERFANDPLNLLAVDGPTNASKGMGDAATWLPPARASRCAYVARQVAVKRSYGLWVTRAERDAMRRVLASCPDEPLPARAR
jgi:hypothetical protein